MERIPFGNTSAMYITDEQVKTDLFNRVTDMWNTRESPYFPGPQPVSIERKHIPILRNNTYRVCAKSDGLRFLFVCVTYRDQPYCFMINRKKDVYLIHMEMDSDAFKGTVLDGELIQNKKTHKYEFLVYDATSVRGDSSIMSLPHSKRMEHALSVVQHIKHTPTTGPFAVKIKAFYPFDQFKMYVEQVVPYIEHNLDGYIFTPEDDPVRSGTHNTMFKWKELYKNTVDFLVVKHYHIPGTYIAKVSRGSVLKSLFDLTLVITKGSDVERAIHASPDPVVVECQYVAQNTWLPLFVRTDKTNPNSFYTWNKTMLNIHEDIQLSEFY